MAVPPSAVAAALWIGLMTSVSPCPLATNVVAVSFVARRFGDPRRVLAGGLLYTAGRSLAYAALGFLLVAGLLSAPALSLALQKHMNRVLGPILVVTGMVLLGLVPLPFATRTGASPPQALGERSGVWGCGLLGILFAMSFCPVSAALFFGSLVPLAVTHGSAVVLPAVYGAGTGLPVLAFAVATALGARSLAGAFHRVAAIERWARGATGAAFVLVGVYYCLVHIFRLLA